MIYRPDIDGLRAIAVLAVVIFHLGVPGFDGGYVGVDVFFVISGLLITSLIIDAREQQRFSLSGFYRRRLWRLIPALLVTILATLFAALWIMTPYDLQSLGRSAAAASVSLSNFLFWSEAGYWDSASEMKPLLHTWSLGVEEQFYLLWPALLLIALAAGGRRAVAALVMVIAVAGAVLCIWFTGIDRDAAFYLLPFRMFQFAVGATLIPLIPLARERLGSSAGPVSSCLLLLGLALIVASVLGFDEDTVFPGAMVLLPTLGAAATLAAGGISTATPLHFLLMNPAALWLGQASYAMYLVHWPIASLYRYETGLDLSSLETVSLAIATLAATAALHYGVERRFYRRDTGETQTAKKQRNLPAIVCAIVGTALLALVFTTPYQSTPRYSEPALTAAQISALMQDRFARLKHTCRLARYPDHPRCQQQSGSNVLVFGNSHEPDALNFLAAGYEATPLNFFMFGTTNRCDEIAVLGDRLKTRQPGCQARLDVLQDPGFLDGIDRLVYAANRPFDRFPQSSSKAEELLVLQHLKSIRPSLQVIILGGYINTDTDCSLLINQSGVSACKERSRIEYFAGDALPPDSFETEFLALGDHYIDRVMLLCKDKQLDTCLVETPDGVPAFIDKHHASRPFAEWSGTLYAAKHPTLFSAESTPSSARDNSAEDRTIP